MKILALFIFCLVGIAQANTEPVIVSASGYGQSTYFNFLTASMAQHQMYRQDATDSAVLIARDVFAETCTNQKKYFDEGTMVVTFKVCDLKGPIGSLDNYYGCYIEFTAKCL